MKSYKIAPLQILPATELLFLNRSAESVEQGAMRLDRFPMKLLVPAPDLLDPLLEHGELGSLDELVKGRVLRPANSLRLRGRGVSQATPCLSGPEGRTELAVRDQPPAPFLGLVGLVGLVRGRRRRTDGRKA